MPCDDHYWSVAIALEPIGWVERLVSRPAIDDLCLRNP